MVVAAPERLPQRKTRDVPAVSGGPMNVLETTGVHAALVHVVEAEQPDGWFLRCGWFVANDVAPYPWNRWIGIETDEATTCLWCLGPP